MTLAPPRPHPPASPGSLPPTFRSSAVARMAGMPVSTLRIWEQRYQAVAPTTAATGHRQYSADDVERVVLLRQLTHHGHAIGTLAALGVEQLRELSRAHLAATSVAAPDAQPRTAALRIVVVGQAMARRLERSAVLDRWPVAPALVAVFDSLAEAAQAAASQKGPPIDLLVWQAPGLQAGAWPGLQAAQAAWRARQVAVAYRFAGATARDALMNAGASVVHEPADDAALVAWLSSLVPLAADDNRRQPSERGPQGADPWALAVPHAGAGPAPARRFDDAALTDFAGLSSGLACECPSHVAELLMQIASFERYSAGCAGRSPADAELHAYLNRVAGAARILFEAALERVASAEGLALP